VPLKQIVNLNIKKNSMDSPLETTEPTETTASGSPEQECPHCVKTAQEVAQNEEVSMAFLLALVPVISLTFFGQLGLL
jgi:hypothetical protein